MKRSGLSSRARRLSPVPPMLNSSAVIATTANTRKMPIANESWLAVRNFITQPH